MENEGSGGMILHLSIFGIKSAWIVAGNLKTEGGCRSWFGAMEFLSAVTLGTETMQRCATCKKRKECQKAAGV
jgi:hypothetical protein